VLRLLNHREINFSASESSLLVESILLIPIWQYPQLTILDKINQGFGATIDV
jgi:hypothetical protein